MGHKITKWRVDVMERGGGRVQAVQRLGHKIIGRTADVQMRGTGAGFRQYSVWATKSPGGEVT